MNKSKSKTISNNKKSTFQKNFDFNLGKLLMDKRVEMKLKRSDIFPNNLYCGEDSLLPSIDYYGRVERGEKSISLFKFLIIIDRLNNTIENYNKENNTSIGKISLEQCLKQMEGYLNENI